MDIFNTLSEEFNLKEEYVSNIVKLIDEGSTIPFIARYRKEMHGSTDDQVLREFADRLKYLRNLEERKSEVKNSIVSQEKWTDEIGVMLENAKTMTEVEDIYRPFKKKRKTRAMAAIEKGLGELADIIMSEKIKKGSVEEIAQPFVSEEKGVNSVSEAISGASDIIAERISDDAELRKVLRELLFNKGVIVTKLDDTNEKAFTYEMYKEYSERIASIPSHRILAVNRGEKEECLKVSLSIESELAISEISSKYIHGDSVGKEVIASAIEDGYARLIFPSIEREVRGELTDKANEQAIKMFEVNLEPLLMQPPLKGKTILGLDPAYRTGCKLALIDKNGDVVTTGVIFPTPPQKKVEEAKRVILDMIDKYKVDVISIGNGTASKESEIFVVDVIKEASRPVSYMVVNEAGASVYSASKLGAEEFPEFDVSKRSAVSIARRLQDPLAELIKIDVKSIGVGQYQHDMPEKRLTEVLEGVVEDCVNKVGVDLTTASYSLLSHVSGLNTSIAKNIIKYRQANGIDTNTDLMSVPKLGNKTFEQCAGFLRIPDGNSVFDNTGIHPESYAAAEKLLSLFNYDKSDVADGNLKELREKTVAYGMDKAALECGVGAPTLSDIIDELMKPGRDIRDSLPKPILRDDLMDIKDLKEGMELTGTVRNVIDFGVFVDIGVHQDGLVHISEISDGYIKHPSEVLKVGETVKVKVLGVDAAKNRISLTMKTSDNVTGIKVSGDTKKSFAKRDNNKDGRRDDRNDRRGGNNRDRNNRNTGEMSLDAMLAKLKNKYSK